MCFPSIYFASHQTFHLIVTTCQFGHIFSSFMWKPRYICTQTKFTGSLERSDRIWEGMKSENRIFKVRLTLTGGRQPPPSLTVASCENFRISFNMIPWFSKRILFHWEGAENALFMHFLPLCIYPRFAELSYMGKVQKNEKIFHHWWILLNKHMTSFNTPLRSQNRLVNWRVFNPLSAVNSNCRLSIHNLQLEGY